MLKDIEVAKIAQELLDECENGTSTSNLMQKITNYVNVKIKQTLEQAREEIKDCQDNPQNLALIDSGCKSAVDLEDVEQIFTNLINEIK